ncbi:MAG: PilZ domain-containing protein [Planctomycetes bacterium]|nr:PilZ domain-containing protein [Planctomycetota bacterium]MCB9909125.1 PilZ domain-containing protein [Planctomycetota bacterium]MCB9911625.1 PilZ domain-containing protein [Planctomycetota bacterium]HPF13306.1 PilZ domain-containing protein [Planctomycetota bacterium]HRV81236.1 PilZ domain-containing protein [Planctomycetota bacterium]
MRFFGRKKDEGAAADHRRHYRKAPGKKHALTARVQLPQSGDVVNATVMDVSAGGVSLQVEGRSAAELGLGTTLWVAFGSLRTRTEVPVQAHVVNRMESKDGLVRFGLSFSDPDELFGRLEPYFLKFFNRRRLQRVLPELGRSLKADVRTTDGGGYRLEVMDLSEEGIGLALHNEEVEWMASHEAFDVEFKIPGANVAWSGSGRRIHLTELKGSHRGGIAFDEPDAKVTPAHGSLEVWLNSRRVAMAKWDSAYE